MKIKLRKLREKKEIVAHYKGGVPLSTVEYFEVSVFKRRGDEVILKEGCIFGKYRHVSRLKHYLNLNLFPKAKKRNGKNR